MADLLFAIECPRLGKTEIMTSQERPHHPSWKLAFFFVVPMLFAVGIIGAFVATTTVDRCINAMLVLACSSVGWALGMMLSPDSAVEERKFSTVWKGTSLFISGYLVSKVDPIIDSLVKPESLDQLAQPLAAYRLLAGISAIILTVILTYVVRVYVYKQEAVTMKPNQASEANGTASIGPDKSS